MRIQKIRMTSHFVRALKSLPITFQETVREQQTIFEKDCFDARLKTHKLKGRLKGLWSFSLTQKHRVLFEIVKDAEVVLIDIGDHAVYK